VWGFGGVLCVCDVVGVAVFGEGGMFGVFLIQRLWNSGVLSCFSVRLRREQ